MGPQREQRGTGLETKQDRLSAIHAMFLEIEGNTTMSEKERVAALIHLSNDRLAAYVGSTLVFEGFALNGVDSKRHRCALSLMFYMIYLGLLDSCPRVTKLVNRIMDEGMNLT